MKDLSLGTPDELDVVAESGQDIVFVIDTTGSMGDDIASVKSQAKSILDAVFDSDRGLADSRIAVVGFNDPDTSTILSFTDQPDPEDRKAAALDAINSISVDGGGDFPEMTFSGLLRALDGRAGEWRDDAAARKIILFGDATAKDSELAPQVYELARDMGIFTIAIGGNSSTVSEYAEIAEKGGGETFGAADSTEIVDTLLEVIDLPIYSIVAASTEIAEGDSGTSVIEISVRRDVANQASEVTLALSGTADGEDRNLLSDIVSFAEGETEKSVSLEIQGDTVVEPDETVTISIESVSEKATIGSKNATVTIVNDDGELPPQTEDKTFTAGNLTLESNVAWEKTGEGYSSAKDAVIKISHAGTNNLLMEVKKGKVGLEGEKLSVNGDIYGAASTELPLVKGSFGVDVESLKVDAFKDDGGDHELAGMVNAVMKGLTITDEKLRFSGDLKFSDNFQKLKTKDSFFNFDVDSSGVLLAPRNLDASWLAGSSDAEIGLSLDDSPLGLSFSNLHASYDLSDDAFYFGGKGSLSWGGEFADQLKKFGATGEFEIDLSGKEEGDNSWGRGDKYLKITRDAGSEKGWKWDIVGSLSYKSDSSPAGFMPSIKEASFSLNTELDKFGGSVESELPVWLDSVVANGRVEGYWDPVQLEEVEFGLKNLSIPLGTTGLELTGGDIAVDGLSGR